MVLSSGRRSISFTTGSIPAFAGLPVTSPLRTVLDLARFSPVFDAPEIAMLAGLMRIGGFAIPECIDAVAGRRNLPAKRLALARLRAFLR